MTCLRYSYVCECFTGYQRSDDGITCEDVDECALSTDSCNQVCVNTAGSYTCDCLDGYTMGSDGMYDILYGVTATRQHCDLDLTY